MRKKNKPKIQLIYIYMYRIYVHNNRIQNVMNVYIYMAIYIYNYIYIYIWCYIYFLSDELRQWKNKTTMNEDVSPIKHGDFPLPC